MDCTTIATDVAACLPHDHVAGFNDALVILAAGLAVAGKLALYAAAGHLIRR